MNNSYAAPLGGDLVGSVLDHTPAGLGSAERLVLIAIAVESPCGQVVSIAAEELRRRTGLSRSRLQSALARLADHGVGVRVAVGSDRLGRPVYAHRGRTSRFRLPALPAPAGCTCEGCGGGFPQGDAPGQPRRAGVR